MKAKCPPNPIGRPVDGVIGGNLELEEATRLRDEIKRLKLLDLEFAADALAGAGETGDREEVKRVRREARAEAAERFRKGRR